LDELIIGERHVQRLEQAKVLGSLVLDRHKPVNGSQVSILHLAPYRIERRVQSPELECHPLLDVVDLLALQAPEQDPDVIRDRP
jgi:hypothetical protein